MRDSVKILPFLKWAGGKRWLVDRHSNLFKGEFERLIEPFVGSGAVFFKLQPKSAILCDRNERLIEVYSEMRTNWKEVADALKEHDQKHSVEYYYQVRGKCYSSASERAAQLIYLNRTCWNGLYRVNSQGNFNVPIGTKSRVILPSDNFELISQCLSGAELFSGDFEKAIDMAKSGDFIFADPPYTVKHNYNGFLKYNEKIFSWDDQVRLRDSIVKAIGRGAKVLVTNAAHESVADLYKSVGEIFLLNRLSVIAGNSSARGKFEEMIVKCY